MAYDPSKPHDEQTTLWRVRHWLNSADLFESKKEHQHFHPRVEDCPDEADIEASRAESYVESERPMPGGRNGKGHLPAGLRLPQTPLLPLAHEFCSGVSSQLVERDF